MQLQVTNRSARSARPHRAGSIALVACTAVSIAQLAAPSVEAGAGIGIGTDFNGDGMADVAIGVPGDTLGNGVRGGTVVVLYGSVSGLTSFGSQQWSQNTPLVDGQADRADWFGGEVAVGDFDADGFSDLAIAAASEDVGGLEDAGVVHVLYGSPSGPTTTGSQMWTLDTPGVPGVSGDFRQFGSVMAAAATTTSSSPTTGSSTLVPSPCSTAARTACRRPVCSAGRRARAASQGTPTRTTTSAAHSPSGTSVPTRTATSRSACARIPSCVAGRSSQSSAPCTCSWGVPQA